MRTLLFLALCGVLAMSDRSVADDEKKKRDPSKAESYDEKVDVRFWDGTKFINPVKGVPAFRLEKDGKIMFWTKHHTARAGNPGKESELTDKDGVVWLVEKAAKGDEFTVCTVKKKPKG